MPKYYVVWEGVEPGIYTSWEDCQEMVINYPGARYKSFPTLESATAAYRNTTGSLDILRAIASRPPVVINYGAIPEIRLDAIAVDGACAKNPGPMEYRGVRVRDGKQLFHFGPLQGGTNNIAEFLAIVHAFALLNQLGDKVTPVYTDSKTALSWIRAGYARTKIEKTAENAKTFELLTRARNWLANNRVSNPLIKWDTEKWGEIPADFGRK